MAETTVTAAALSGADLVLRQGIQFVISAILARMLTPADFGLVAVALAVIGVLTAVADLGIRTTLIRLPTVDSASIASAYWLVLASSAFVGMITASVALVFNGRSHTPTLAMVILSLTPAIVLNAVGGVSVGLLIRSLRFGALAMIGVVATVLGGITAFAVARHGSGPWPLVAMTLVTAAVTAVGTTITVTPNLLSRPSATHIRALVGFGRWVVGILLLDAAASRVPTMLVGSRFGPADAGQFSRADVTTQAAKEGTDSILGRVALPLLSRSSNDDPAFITGLRTGLRFGMAAMAPLMLFLAAMATPLMLTLFGPQWGPAGPMFAALAVGAAAWPIHVVVFNALLARGQAKTALQVDIRNKTVLVGLALVGAAVSPVGVAWAVAASQLLAAGLFMRALAQAAPYPVSRQVADTLPVVAVAVPWAIGAAWASAVWGGPPVVVVTTLLAGCITGWLLTAHLCGVTVFRELVRRLRRGADAT